MTFVKGHPGFKKKGTKNRETILKEERRSIFEEEVSQIFIETIRKARPEYLLDQYLGKAPDEVRLEVKPSEEITALAAQAAELLKKKKI